MLAKSAFLSSDIYKTPAFIHKTVGKTNKTTLVSVNKDITSMYVLDKNKLFVTFRGCKNAEEVINCIETKVLKPLKNRPYYINSAIWNKFEAEKENADKCIKYYIENYNISDIIFTGHSLGGALAQLASNFYEKSRQHDEINHCITFGSPFVGDVAFKNSIEGHVDTIKRVAVKKDIVPQIKFNKILTHNGDDLIYDFKSNQPFPLNIYDYHKSINYIRCVMGTIKH